MTTEDNEHQQPGTAAPARLRKAACGIRFDEDELQEGIDFSAASKLKPGISKAPRQRQDVDSSTVDKHR
ncbi:hypothetical protein [Marinobacter sp. VGCF2001]|uniref:hypothetical protein n=1 Tax=Marinobacter sp. VGCF2001 TaxID=3417189 RepID=UPI003CED4BEA